MTKKKKPIPTLTPEELAEQIRQFDEVFPEDTRRIVLDNEVYEIPYNLFWEVARVSSQARQALEMNSPKTDELFDRRSELFQQIEETYTPVLTVHGVFSGF